MDNKNLVKMGVIGVGHLGNFHVQQLKTIPEVELIGIFDQSVDRLKQMGSEHDVQIYESYEELLNNCDAVSIVTPTNTHFEVAHSALEKQCHLFIEKPITQTVSEARKLLQIAEAKNRIIQVGHIEQFNPAFLELGKYRLEPGFIECHRLAPFNSRGTDVPVVLDLMIHDIGIVLDLVNTGVKDIRASGVKVVSDTVDIANARLEFTNGCIANLTASRISQKKMRKLRIFQENSYITVDFLLGVVETYDIAAEKPTLTTEGDIFPLEGHRKKFVIYRKPAIKKGNALKLELEHFVESIRNYQSPMVDGRRATDALQVAMEIQNIIEKAN